MTLTSYVYKVKNTISTLGTYIFCGKNNLGFFHGFSGVSLVWKCVPWPPSYKMDYKTCKKVLQKSPKWPFNPSMYFW